MQTITVCLIYKFGFFAIILKLGVKMLSFPAAMRLLPAVIRTEWTLQEPAGAIRSSSSTTRKACVHQLPTGDIRKFSSDMQFLPERKTYL